MSALYPELWMAVFTGGAILYGALWKRGLRILSYITLVGALLLVGFTFYDAAEHVVFHALSVTPFLRFFDLIVLLSGLFFLMLLPPDTPREVDLLLPPTLLGMMLLAKSVDLVAAFFSLELLTFGFYFLVGYAFRDARATESAVKYFILGAFSSALMGMGLVLLFMEVRTTYLPDVLRFFSVTPLSTLALLFLAGGVLFKVAAFPFQFWTPDVYSGAPTSVVAFLNAAPKAVGFLLLIRVFLATAHSPLWEQALPWIAVITMFWGNWVALRQRELKRMLAYSTIAHVGYLLLALLVSPPLAGLRAAGFYLAAYTVMSFGAFAVLSMIRPHPTLQDLRGMVQTRPYLALALTLFLAALAGIPGTVGFAAKALLFLEVLRSGHTLLAVIALINGVISAYYYLLPVASMFMEEDTAPEPLPPYRPLPLALTQITALLVLYLGLYPFPLLYLLEVSLAG